jgi:hypothetical protein
MESFPLKIETFDNFRQDNDIAHSSITTTISYNNRVKNFRLKGKKCYAISVLLELLDETEEGMLPWQPIITRLMLQYMQVHMDLWQTTQQVTE